MSTYPFTIASDGLFPNRRVNKTRLAYEVNAVLTAKFTGISEDGGNCLVQFSSDLSPAEETQLATVILAHTGEASAPQSVSSLVETTTTSTSYVQLNGMALTPPAGEYNASFGCSVEASVKGQEVKVALFVDGVIVPSSVRRIHKGTSVNQGAVYPVFGAAQISVNGSQVVEVRWIVSSGASVTCYERSLMVSI